MSSKCRFCDVDYERTVEVPGYGRVPVCSTHSRLKIKELQAKLTRQQAAAVDRTGGGEVATPEAPELPPVPRPQATTPRQSFRVRTELWRRSQEKAYAQGETVSDVLRRALEEYVA